MNKLTTSFLLAYWRDDMKKLSKSIVCLTLAIVMSGGSPANAISSGEGLIGSQKEVLSHIINYAGTGAFSHEDGEAFSAAFRTPYSITSLPDGSVLVSDRKNHLIRRIANSVVEPYAGLTLENDNYGLPQGGWSDGNKDSAVFFSPAGMTADEAGNVYIADSENNVIRRISIDGKVTTVAGNGFVGNQDGAAKAAGFNCPQDVAVAKDGTLYVADTLNHVIRKISVNGDVYTLNAPSTRTVEVVAGYVEFVGDYLDGEIRHAKFNEPSGLVIDKKGNLYVSDTGNQLIRYIDFETQTVITVGGNIKQSSAISNSNTVYAAGGHSDGTALEASFNFPKGLAITEENGILIADSQNHTIRYLLNGQVTTLAGDPRGSHGNSDGINGYNLLHHPTDVAVHKDGSILIADSYNNLIRKFNLYQLPERLVQDNQVRIVVNSEMINLDTPPEDMNGRTMIPIASFAKIMGYSLHYDNHDKTVSIGKDETTMKFYINKPNITISKLGSDEIEKVLDVVPYQKDFRAYVPIRALCEEFGYDVQWDQDSRTVIIRETGSNLQSSLFEKAFEAEPMRVAQIEKVTGIVHIQKAGGAKAFRAHEGFILNHGDHIKTEAHSSIELKVSDTKDQLTIDESAQLYFSDLRSEANSNITRFFIWSGSIWAKVSTLVNSQSKYEIETPMAYMSVRGTQLFVSVDPLTGLMSITMGSGVAEVRGNRGSNSDDGTLLFPGQQMILGDDILDALEDYTNIVDLEALINSIGVAIIQSLIANKAAMDAENEEYLSDLQESIQNGGIDQETIDRWRQNLDNLLGNIINQAIKQNKIDQNEINELIRRINEQLDKKLDLANVRQLVLSEFEKARQERNKKLEEERKKKEEEAKKKLEELRKKNEELNNILNKQREKQEEERRKAEEAEREKAAEEHAKQLADDVQRAAYEASQKAIAEERAKQEALVAAKEAEDEAKKRTEAVEPPNDDSRDDTPPPPRPDTTSPDAILIYPTDVLFSNETDQELIVRAEKDAVVKLLNSNGDILDSTIGLDGNVKLRVSDLTEGIYNFTVTATDEAGNITTLDVPAITIDLTPPELFDQKYDRYKKTFTIIAELGTTIQLIEVFEDGREGVILFDDIELDKEGKAVFSISELDKGQHILIIKAIDAAGNITYGIKIEESFK